MFRYFLHAKGENFGKTDHNVYSDNHGQILWDEHVKNNIFLKIYNISFTKSTPSSRNNVDVHLNYYGNNYNTCSNNIVIGERGIRVYKGVNN